MGAEDGLGWRGLRRWKGVIKYTRLLVAARVGLYMENLFWAGTVCIGTCVRSSLICTHLLAPG